jgi:putative PIN family toxin of toxin-antitoxin system
MLTVLVDTNVMMVAVSPNSNLHWLYQALINEEFSLIVSNDIMLEYEEQLRFRYGESVVSEFLLILAEAPNVIDYEPHFRWNLVNQDPDENKFVDAYITGSANYIVTHDKHFDVLRPLSFPKINVVNAYEFQTILKNQH